MALIVQPCLRNASASTTNSHASILRRGPFQQLPDSDTREPGRGPPTTGGSQTASRLGVVIFDEQDWSLSDERRHKVDVPDPVAEAGPVKGKSTEGSDDEDREQRPYRGSVHAFDGSPPNRHSVEVLILWGHKAPLCPSLPDALVADRHPRSGIARRLARSSSRASMNAVFGALPISQATRHARHSSRSSASMVSMLHTRGASVRTPSFTLHPRDRTRKGSD